MPVKDKSKPMYWAICWVMVFGMAAGGYAVAQPPIVKTHPDSDGVTPILTGSAISCWEGGQRFCFLEMKSMALVPKTWGPFHWEDSRDIVVEDCHLEMDGAGLVAGLQQVGQTLVRLGKTQEVSRPHPPSGWGNGPGPHLTPIPLPPKIEARNFSCAIHYPEGRVLTLQADLATIDPSHPTLELEGRVQVVSSLGSRLEAETLTWEPFTQQLQVQSPYHFRWGARRRQGRGARFAMDRGDFKELKSGKNAGLAGPKVIPQLSPVELVALGGKGRNQKVSPMFWLMCLGGLQSQTENQPGVAPGKFNHSITPLPRTLPRELSSN